MKENGILFNNNVVNASKKRVFRMGFGLSSNSVIMIMVDNGRWFIDCNFGKR